MVKTRSQTSKPVTGESRLLSLPAELRNRIYELALPTLLCVESEEEFEAANLDMPQQPSLTRVNRQIRDESLQLYYGLLTVRLFLHWTEDLVQYRCWFEAIGKNFRLIKRFEFKDAEECTHDNYIVLKWSPVLTRFQLSVLAEAICEQDDCYIFSEFDLEDETQLCALHHAIKKGESGALQVAKVIESLLW